ERGVGLEEEYGGIGIVGYGEGYFGRAEDEEVIGWIGEGGGDLLFVGRGAENQERWIDKQKDGLEVGVRMGVGGSFDVIWGKTKRGPIVFEKLRVEWFY
ncbi:WecB/TagA/CpsF family glycosyltransferase, partial [Paenibacillus xylanexedens]|uniref:WecB/TagA/CpsF family glycosyltransferase n=1 Tax=Paenibacillus xylanexedens TaxID=528191 RepID=UPI001642F830